MQPPRKIAVVGSSHVSWWEHAIETGQIPAPSLDIRFIGIGAMPIWGDFIRSGIAGVEDHVDGIFLLLGDFRHGNRILQDKTFLQTGDTSGKFLNIAKELISDDNDKILLGLIVNYLNELRGRFGPKLRILFWSLTYREFQSLESGRYGGRGNYQHPVWNLSELVSQFSDVAIDTTSLLELPIHSFYLDASGHPTFKGHAFLSRLLNGQTAIEAYQSVCDDFARWGHLLFPPHAGRYRVNITGHSIAFEALAKAVRTGYFPMPANWSVVNLKALKTAHGDCDRVVYFSGLHFQDETPAQIQAKIAEEKAAIAKLGLGHQLQVIFWDQWARETVSKRAEYQDKFLPKAAEGYVGRIEAAFAPVHVTPLSGIAFGQANGMVELGGSFTPSGNGFAALFHLMIANDLLPTAFLRYHEMARYCLNPAPIAIAQDAGNPDTAPHPLRRESLQGGFYGVSTAGKLCGWAIAIHDPTAKVRVHFFYGNERIGSTIANQLWADFQFDDGGDGGFYGFCADELPLSLLKTLTVGSEIRACFDTEGQFELPGSPIKLKQDELAKLVLAVIVARPAEYHALRHSAGKDYRIPTNGSSLFIAKQTPPENDPSIFPAIDLVLDNAIVEAIKRLPDFFKGVVRSRMIGGVYHQNGKLEISALLSSAFGVGQLADPILTVKPSVHIAAECVYGGMIIEHYGHFIIESLARFLAFQRYPSYPIVFTSYNPQITTADALPTYIKAIFALLGIPLTRIILLHETTSFDKLVIPKIGVRWFDYLQADHQRAMAATVKANFSSAYPQSKRGSIYLSRSKLNTNHGGNIICGEAAFEAYLRSEGVTVVYPETLPVHEQVLLFCSARNLIGFVGSGFHTLLLCADLPEKIFYLTRNKAEVNPQFPLIDKVLGIEGHYLQNVIKSSAKVTLVDFAAMSQEFMTAGLVQKPFNAATYDFEKEFTLLSDWLAIKPKGKKVSARDVERLELIRDDCLNPVIVREIQDFLAAHPLSFQQSKEAVFA